MNESTFKESTKRLLELNKIIKNLDETIRPAAFSLLQDYVYCGVSAAASAKPSAEGKIRQQPVEVNELSEDRESFFSKFNHDKPSDNALLVSAYYYGQYGASPFSIDELKTLANEVGVTVPERPDMTFKMAQRDGKNLFLRAGRGVYRPTVYGEAFFKKTYEVSKGKLQKPQVDE
jgi:hypothetical protein